MTVDCGEPQLIAMGKILVGAKNVTPDHQVEVILSILRSVTLGLVTLGLLRPESTLQVCGESLCALLWLQQCVCMDMQKL